MDENQYNPQDHFEDLPLETEEFLKEENLLFLNPGKKSHKVPWAIFAHLASFLLSLSLLVAALKVGFASGHCNGEAKEVYKNISTDHFRRASLIYKFCESWHQLIMLIRPGSLL